jgi:hypothetical protein
MTTAAIPTSFAWSELEARVFDFDAAIARARAEMERDAATLMLAYLQLKAQHRFGKLETQLGMMMGGLTDVQLREVSELLLRPLPTLKPTLRALRAKQSIFRRPERFVLDSLCGLVARVEIVAEQLALEAAKGQRPANIVYPLLDDRMRQQSKMASALLPAVRRDRSEADPDPDYGL